MNYKKRVKTLQKSIKQTTLISDPDDIFYYSGYQTGEDDVTFLLLKKSGKPLLLISPLVSGFKPKYADIFNVTNSKQLLKLLPKTVGIDEYNLPAALFTKIKKPLNYSDIIKEPRSIKSSQEIDLMMKAIRINKKILSSLSLFNKKEINIAKEIDLSFVKNNATFSFETLVASGPNSGNHIHHFPGQRKTTRKDPIIIDFGAKVDGYCSDITRTHLPKSKKRLFEDVLEVQQECIDLVKPGVLMSEINKYYETMLRRKGYKPRHGIGHGLGVTVHEHVEELRKGMVITIEPGIYVKNSSGCRIEDMILVKKNKGKNLSKIIHPYL